MAFSCSSLIRSLALMATWLLSLVQARDAVLLSCADLAGCYSSTARFVPPNIFNPGPAALICEDVALSFVARDDDPQYDCILEETVYPFGPDCFDVGLPPETPFFFEYFCHFRTRTAKNVVLECDVPSINELATVVYNAAAGGTFNFALRTVDGTANGQVSIQPSTDCSP